jgi:hypothetical protein
MRIISVVLIAMLYACGGSDSSPTDSSTPGENTSTLSGETIYNNPVEKGNTFTCATCHALSEPAAHLILKTASSPLYSKRLILVSRGG